MGVLAQRTIQARNAENLELALRQVDVISTFAASKASAASIEGDLYDIVAKDLRRRTAEEITVYKNVGSGHLDLMTAEFVAQRLGLL